MRTERQCGNQRVRGGADAKNGVNPVAQANLTPLALGMKEAARACGCGRAFFYELLAKDQGPRTFYLGRRRLVRIEELARWLRAREEASTSAGGSDSARLSSLEAE